MKGKRDLILKDFQLFKMDNPSLEVKWYLAMRRKMFHMQGIITLLGWVVKREKALLVSIKDPQQTSITLQMKVCFNNKELGKKSRTVQCYCPFNNKINLRTLEVLRYHRATKSIETIFRSLHLLSSNKISNKIHKDQA